ncbi:histidine kinase [Clavibacter sepedonicus]|uniref:histidine kinase n=1 Tax=Clavibacter sepedonicus TaxID=31964 RepID=B0RBQ8_CLASE|nr:MULTISPECIES: sensor histidine kinase [Clavibacter]MBD5382172.1 sensor histidine kinase [Clavibacter sp.]OQJ48889.1 two-component sensor histidine kinase [Clavibacter sepedonicus]OQJ53800.1 two-component sensor histidine kinase [Clavibacter sepedonicus]UUK65309.1 sensor histidine kinase [Clavibacter sepedonicus]CAQ00459.1 putative two-component system sensor kinase [Clavibacter sepedonicus]
MNETPPTTEAESTPVPPEDLPAAPADADDRADVDAGDATRPPALPRRRSFYADAWRHLPRDLGYLALTALLLATVYFALPTAVYSLFDSLLWSASGIFAAVALLAALFAARGLGAVERVRIGWAEPRPIRPVDWTPRWQQNRAMRILSAVANPHYWLHLLHAVVVYPLVSFVTLGAGALLVAGFLGPIGGGIAILGYGWRFEELLVERGYDAGRTFALAGVLGVTAMILSVVLLPLWGRGAVLAHYWTDHALLGGFKSDVLERRVQGLEQSRAGAVTAEGQTLRQIERDLHDGPQQRLVRLRMDLAAAERALDTDPERARTLIAEASEHAHDTLEELRALSRGFAPPILLDRGLVAALEALASRSTVPVALDVHLPENLVLPTEVERNVYFTVSELLTNVAKHSGATRADVTLVLMRDFDGTRILVARVTDDGQGGASVREGHGLEGLVGRIGALDGDVSISSPQGGPTRITARVPLLTLNGVPTDGSAGAGPAAGGPVAASPDPAA